MSHFSNKEITPDRSIINTKEYSCEYIASDEESVSSSLKTPNSVCTSRNPSSDLDEQDFISTGNEQKLAEEQKKWVQEGPQAAKSTNPKKYFWHGLKLS